MPDKSIYIAEYQSSIGPLLLGEYCGKICLCFTSDAPGLPSLLSRLSTRLKAPIRQCQTVLLNNAFEALREYFEGTRFQFDIPLLLVGSEFQQKIWIELERVPYGTVISYSDLARKAGVHTAVRAAASAVAANPLLIFVPCHRVVRNFPETLSIEEIISRPKILGNFAAGIPLKATLLNLETSAIEHSTLLYDAE